MNRGVICAACLVGVILAAVFVHVGNSPLLGMFLGIIFGLLLRGDRLAERARKRERLIRQFLDILEDLFPNAVLEMPSARELERDEIWVDVYNVEMGRSEEFQSVAHGFNKVYCWPQDEYSLHFLDRCVKQPQRAKQ